LFTLGSFFENNRRSPHFGATFFLGKGYVLVLTKNGFSFILGNVLQTHQVTLLEPHPLEELNFIFLNEASTFTTTTEDAF
jgi:hypothetical protein